MNKDFKNKVYKAIKHCLDLRDYEVIGEVDDFIVCREIPHELCFAHVIVRIKNESLEFPKSDLNLLRLKFERAQVKWFEEHGDEYDLHLRCDELQMLVINDDRAIIRHVIDVF